jgi:hypothetical protein
MSAKRAEQLFRPNVVAFGHVRGCPHIRTAGRYKNVGSPVLVWCEVGTAAAVTVSFGSRIRFVMGRGHAAFMILGRSSLVLAALLAASCSASSSGARTQLCGRWIGQGPGANPYYVDAAAHSESQLSTHINGGAVVVRVSDDCDRGASISVSDPDVVGVRSALSASGGPVAIILISRRQGRAVITARTPDHVRHLTVTVGPQLVPSLLPAPDRETTA